MVGHRCHAYVMVIPHTIRRYCVIYADAAALERVSKAWVPKKYDGQDLWFKSEDVINSYIKKLEESWDPAKTLRMSIIDGRENNDLQMLIPFGLLDSNGGGMKIKVTCKENIKDIPSERINYDNWGDNIRGNRTPDEEMGQSLLG